MTMSDELLDEIREQASYLRETLGKAWDASQKGAHDHHPAHPGQRCPRRPGARAGTLAWWRANRAPYGRPESPQEISEERTQSLSGWRRTFEG